MIKNTVQLRQVLCQTINNVRNDRNSIVQAIAISNIAANIIKSLKVDMEAAMYSKREFIDEFQIDKTPMTEAELFKSTEKLLGDKNIKQLYK